MIFHHPWGAGDSEGGNFAEHCFERRFFAASAAVWSAGFAADPTLAEDTTAQNRYKAACAAARAATGEGIEKPPPDKQAKSRWRKQALEWLKADLTYWTKQAETAVPEAKELVSKKLEHWRGDSDLASVREEKELAGLTERERTEWQAFWAEVTALFKKVNRN